jgi:hypothetical protein
MFVSNVIHIYGSLRILYNRKTLCTLDDPPDTPSWTASSKCQITLIAVKGRKGRQARILEFCICGPSGTDAIM